MLHEEYYCTKCGTILNNQSGFDPENNSWSCKKCGQQLYSNDVYNGDIYKDVMWYCDRCGALLNEQDGFYDYCDFWICTECYHPNPITVDEIDRDSDGNPITSLH
jgi:hypothetical protein